MESFAESFIASAFALFDSDMDFVEIVSVKEDEAMLDLEHQKSDEVYAGLADVHNELSNIISDYRKPIWNMPPKEEAEGLVQPEEKPQMDWGDMHAITETTMSLPTNYCPKADNEDLIGCLPNMYIMTCGDQIKTILTLGLYYCFVVHKKQQYRSGFMLTTNRLVRKGKEGKHMYPRDRDPPPRPRPRPRPHPHPRPRPRARSRSPSRPARTASRRPSRASSRSRRT